MRTSINPTEQNISEIENWLLEEYNNQKEGFITNWEMIPEAFKENRISIITENDKAIAFAVFRIYDEMAVIDIAEIEPIERGKGIARKFINETLDILKSKGVIVVKLFCSPEKSEGFWKKCGFQRFEFPNNSQINMYKTLVEVLNPSKNSIKPNHDKLKLWDCEPHLTDRNEPKWIWELEYKNDNKTLVKPIIYPAYYDWQIELESENKIITDKVKYFPIDISHNGTFMIINKIENTKH
ncbi:GNAT family N-acetyltransferase [Gillisia sp. CAL575]|uniref:GNAT family N-acetyltransferase n=1 Tax=Gillisia sp. CAL575 TaxID=985255 RepID=UPI000399AD32|nr:GNAT family N-acetyltransferase [Gillisia sp. CAL575]